MPRAEPFRVLFLCTGNSCRSQMGEGWARALLGNLVEVHSAGTSPQGLNPLAVRVMHESGVDISRHESKPLDSLRAIEFDYVITVCDAARESCPAFPAKVRLIHQSFDDPPRLAQGAKSDDEALPHYRRVRDEIKEFVQRLPLIWKGVRS